MTTPSHIGQYRILRKIGAGGMGLVYLGEHTLLGRRAAIKTLLPTVAVHPELVERFFNEARATSAISDPGVIQVFDFGYHVDGTAYIVMELLEGESLASRIDRLGTIALGDALRIARQIAGSLAAAHARDIIHRDLKPENIFLVADAAALGGERCKILDFGICKLGTSDATITQSGAMIGTPVYMSPEQCRGTGDVDHRADIYALGCLAFHMVTGRPPFLGEAPGELIVAHLREPAPAASTLAPALPPAVDALIARCLAKQPADRFASMTELADALGDLAVHAEQREARARSAEDGAQDITVGEQIEPPAVVAVAPSPQVPLGRGFRSVFDGNLAARFMTPSRDALVTSSLRGQFTLHRATPPANDQRRIEDTYDDLDVTPAPRWRTGVRAALAGVLALGIVLGLVATSIVLDGDEHHAVAAVSAALPVEGNPGPEIIAAAPPAPVEAAVEAPAEAPVDAERPALTPVPARTATAHEPPVSSELAVPRSPERDIARTSVLRAKQSAAAERSRRSRETARDGKKAKPRTRTAAVLATPAPRTPPAFAPSMIPPPPTPTFASPPAPTAALATAPAEDLYDTR